MFVIFGRLKTKERKFEPILAARFSMTTARIAAGFGEDGDDLVGEIDRMNGFEVIDGYRHFGGQTIRPPGSNGRSAIGQRLHETMCVHVNDSLGNAFVSDLAREIMQGPGTLFRRDEQLL